MSGFKMDDYVDVAERIRDFNRKYPEGSLQAELVYMENPAGWLCVAQAYRTPDDPRPGVGHAFESVPGKTPYTRDSEAQNAETSAWGRAIVALGFETKKIASRQEVRNRSEPESQFKPPAAKPTPTQKKQFAEVISNLAATDPSKIWADIANKAAQRDFGRDLSELNKDQMETLGAKFSEHLLELKAKAA